MRRRENYRIYGDHVTDPRGRISFRHTCPKCEEGLLFLNPEDRFVECDECNYILTKTDYKRKFLDDDASDYLLCPHCKSPLKRSETDRRTYVCENCEERIKNSNHMVRCPRCGKFGGHYNEKYNLYECLHCGLKSEVRPYTHHLLRKMR